MGDLDPGASAMPGGADPAFSTARALLEQAEADARRMRAEAAQFARRREQEAELLLAKARRVLVAAEERAAVIIATTRARAADGSLDLLAFEADDVIGRVIAPGATRLHPGGHPTRLDRMLAAAIAHAVDDTFPVEITV